MTTLCRADLVRIDENVVHAIVLEQTLLHNTDMVIIYHLWLRENEVKIQFLYIWKKGLIL